MSISNPGNGHSTSTQYNDSNVVDIFSKQETQNLLEQQFVRLSPEYDGLCILYSNKHCSDEKLYTMKILCWGIRANGEVVGIVAWMNKAIPCTELKDADHGFFEGYYDTASEDIFFSPPAHKIVELETASGYNDSSTADQPTTEKDSALYSQEIPDSIGTHAMIYSAEDNLMVLTEVLSWRLLANGEMEAMLINEDLVDVTPVLPGDPCLYPATSNKDFRYFFQHHIANLIKSNDPETLDAISVLFN